MNRNNRNTVSFVSFLMMAIILFSIMYSMIYATVYQLVTESDSYVGKMIRIKGNFLPNWYEPTSRYY